MNFTDIFIKRPVLDRDGQFSVAFSDAQYTTLFQA